MAAQDAWDRLLQPSIEREIRADLTERASASAIQVFGKNLHQLLMAPPVKGRVTLGVDPGFRTGCKLAVVDENGKVLATGVGHFTLPGQEAAKARARRDIIDLCRRFGVTAIAIGNGTASREAEQFIASLLPGAAEGRGLYDRQRGGRVRVFGQQAGGGGVPAVRCVAAQRGQHRPPHAGPAGRAGQDRPQGHRRGAVPA